MVTTLKAFTGYLGKLFSDGLAFLSDGKSKWYRVRRLRCKFHVAVRVEEVCWGHSRRVDRRDQQRELESGRLEAKKLRRRKMGDGVNRGSSRSKLNFRYL